MNKKEFIIRCSNENTRLVENIVLPYHSYDMDFGERS